MNSVQVGIGTAATRFKRVRPALYAQFSTTLVTSCAEQWVKQHASEQHSTAWALPELHSCTACSCAPCVRPQDGFAANAALCRRSLTLRSGGKRSTSQVA